MYNKNDLLQLFQEASDKNHVPRFLFNLVDKNLVPLIAMAFNENDEFSAYSTYCTLNGACGHIFLLKDRLLFVHYPFVIPKIEIFFVNVATFYKETNVWITLNIIDASGRKYRIFNLTTECADAIIEHINKLKVTTNN